jgi:hypothetical protein
MLIAKSEAIRVFFMISPVNTILYQKMYLLSSECKVPYPFKWGGCPDPFDILLTPFHHMKIETNTYPTSIRGESNPIGSMEHLYDFTVHHFSYDSHW